MATAAEVEVVWVPAQVSVQAYQWITSGGQIADSTNPKHMNRVVGIVRETTPAGKAAPTMQFGEITNTSWDLGGTQGLPLYLTGKYPSVTPPTSGMLVQLGWVKNRTTMIVDVGLPVLLA